MSSVIYWILVIIVSITISGSGPTGSINISCSIEFSTIVMLLFVSTYSPSCRSYYCLFKSLTLELIWHIITTILEW